MTARRSSAPTLLATSHGTSDPRGQRAVASLVGAVAERLAGVPVMGGFVDVQQPDVAASIALIAEDRPVVIVPLLLSAGYHVNVDLASAAGVGGPDRVAVAPALGPDMRLATLLARRLAEAGLVQGDAIVLAAAGSSDANAVGECHRVGQFLSITMGRPVSVGFISAAEPRLADAVTGARGLAENGRVAIATYLLAPGYFAGLVHLAGADVVSAPLLAHDECPPTELVEITIERYRDLASSRWRGVTCDERVTRAYHDLDPLVTNG